MTALSTGIGTTVTVATAIPTVVLGAFQAESSNESSISVYRTAGSIPGLGQAPGATDTIVYQALIRRINSIVPLLVVDTPGIGTFRYYVVVDNIPVWSSVSFYVFSV